MADNSADDELYAAFGMPKGEQNAEPSSASGSAGVPPLATAVQKPAEPNNPNDAELYAAFGMSLAGASPRNREGMPATATIPPKPRPTPAANKTVHAQPTLYHQAPIKQPGEKDLTVGETLRGAASNLVPSALGVVSSFGHALTHPGETLGAIGDIGTGLLSKAAGATGAKQDQAKKKQEERAVDALWDHYKKTYFTSGQDFMRSFKNDPASILLDFSTLTGVGSAALPGKIGKAAQVASTITDPIQSSLAIARGVGSIPAKGVRVLQATASGVPYATLTDIYNLARKGDPLLREGVELGRKLPETEITRRFVDALDTAADAASADYLTSKAGMVHVNKKPPINPVLQAIQKAEDDLTIAGVKPHPPTSSGVVHPYWDAYQELQNLRQQALAYDANPAYNLLEADKFKRSLYERRGQVSGKAQNSVDRVAEAVRDSIAATSQDYAKIMDKWQSWIQTAKGIKQGGANANLSPAASMTRLINSMKSDLKRKNVIDVLAKHDEQLPYILAGYATKPMHKGNIGLMDAILSGAGWYAVSHPLGAVGSLGLASPRLSSASQSALGKIAKYGAAATSRPVTSGAYYGERALQEEGQQPSEETIGMPQADVSAPRSVRNNNPGNIIDSSFARNQPGYVGNDAGFAVFDNEQSGVEAHKKLLENYGMAGRNTVDTIIDRWSPANAEGNTPEATENYKKHVADKLGVNKNDPLDMSDPAIIDALSQAMAEFESGIKSSNRIGRASGGRIMNHKSEAEGLIRLADKAKKALNNSTESLLAVPDEAVTKALSIANEAI